jgi:hypothetical protein
MEEAHTTALAKRAVGRIPSTKLVELPDLGYAAQIQDPANFHKVLLRSLLSRSSNKTTN